MAKDKSQNKTKGGFVIIALYVIAIFCLLYGLYMIYYSIDYVQLYYAQQGQTFSANAAEGVQYILSNTMEFFFFSVLSFGMIRLIDNSQKSIARMDVLVRADEARKARAQAAAEAEAVQAAPAEAEETAEAAVDAAEEAVEAAPAEAEEAAAEIAAEAEEKIEAEAAEVAAE